LCADLPTLHDCHELSVISTVASSGPAPPRAGRQPPANWPAATVGEAAVAF
jgi:hypothetical protein